MPHQKIYGVTWSMLLRRKDDSSQGPNVEGGLDPVSSIIRRTVEPRICKELFQREFIAYLGYGQGIMEMEPDIKNMTLNEYLEYEVVKEKKLWDNVRSKSSLTRQKKNPLKDHSDSFTPQFFAQLPNTPNTPVDKKDYDFDEILDDLFSDVDLENEEDEVEDDDDGDTYNIWDITVEDVE
ncbi:hypothetical protein Tco_1429384 [Tanacetum coccineum]